MFTAESSVLILRPSTRAGHKIHKRLWDKKEESPCPPLVPSMIRPEPSHRAVD